MTGGHVRIKFITAVGAAIVIALSVGVSLAFGHVGHIAADCDAAHFTWTQFPQGTNHPTYFLQVDNMTPQQGTATFNGPTGALDVPLLLSRIGGPHSIHAISTWSEDGGGKAETTITVDCGRPPTPPTPPAATPPTTTPPAQVISPTPVVSPPVKRVAKCEHITVNGKMYIVCKKRKVCKLGRRHLVDSHGRHFSMCRKPAIAVRTPKFTG